MITVWINVEVNGLEQKRSFRGENVFTNKGLYVMNAAGSVWNVFVYSPYKRSNFNLLQILN